MRFKTTHQCRVSPYLTGDSASFQGYFMEGVSVRKSKLTNLYLTLPVFFEVQTKSAKNKEKMHFAAGVVVGWRVRTHTKIYYTSERDWEAVCLAYLYLSTFMSPSLKIQ